MKKREETGELDRNFALEVVRVTEAAALAASNWRGKGDEKAADQAAVDAMRVALNGLDIDGTVVIGEGERDEAPMLYIGEKIGTGKGPKIDIALDPLEGTTICATGGANALAVVAMAVDGGFLNAPDVYMEKIAIGPNLPKTFLDLDKPLEETLQNISKYKKKKISDIVVCVLDRPRHKRIFDIIDKCKCKKLLIPDGDIVAAISTSIRKENIDLYTGIGGAPEGVLAAAALKCLGGQMQCRLIFKNDIQKRRAKKMGITNLNKKYKINDLIKNDVIFVASGVTDGTLLKGVKKIKNKFIVQSLIITTEKKKIEFVNSEFRI